MVQAGLGDDSGTKLIEQRGIDFAPTDDLMQNLKTQGASDTFLKVLRVAKPPEPASGKKPINQAQVFALLAGQVPSHRVAMLAGWRRPVLQGLRLLSPIANKVCGPAKQVHVALSLVAVLSRRR
jgi:hypothetical protein